MLTKVISVQVSKSKGTLVVLLITNTPIILALETKHNNGRRANGSWTDCSTFSHSLRLSSSFCELSKARATMTVGTIATDRVTNTRIHFFTRKLRKPAITNWPATQRRPMNSTYSETPLIRVVIPIGSGTSLMMMIEFPQQ